MSSTCPITAIIPACERIPELLRCLSTIERCDPTPAEVIVYVDGGSSAVADAVGRSHPTVRVLIGEGFLGPGGARNCLVAASSHEIVANFDDDSFPEHLDYFQRVLEGFRLFPQMAVLSAASQASEKESPVYMHIGIFSGCGCVFSKTWFEKTTGHVPLRVAYCMEEVDLSLRLHALGGLVVHDPLLQVCHIHGIERSVFSAENNAQILANTALLPYLRYPLILAPLGIWNVLRRVQFLIQKGWHAGIGRGLLLIPRYFVRFHSYRSPLPMKSILSWFALRKKPRPLAVPSVPA